MLLGKNVALLLHTSVPPQKNLINEENRIKKKKALFTVFTPVNKRSGLVVSAKTESLLDLPQVCWRTLPKNINAQQHLVNQHCVHSQQTRMSDAGGKNKYIF